MAFHFWLMVATLVGYIVGHILIMAKQKHLECKKGKANQKQELSD